MNCPQCKEHMSSRQIAKEQYCECLYCQGVWVPMPALVAISRDARNGASSAQIERSLSIEGQASPRACPNCENNQLTSIEFRGVEIDQCKKCKGVFFDKGEIERAFPDGMPEDWSSEIAVAGIRIFDAILFFFTFR